VSPEDLNSPQQTWSWPDSLDALVAASAFHSLIFENDRVRVLQTRILPGQTVPVHTHRWPCVLFISSWSDFVRRDHLGNVTLDTRLGFQSPALHSPAWMEPLPPHTVENVGCSELFTIQVEIKSVL